MSSYKFKLKKFNGLKDITLWKVKTRALIFQQGRAMDLKGEVKLLQDMVGQVDDQTTTSSLWEKLFD